MINALRLYDPNNMGQNEVILKIYNRRTMFSAEGILSVNNFVCEDIDYAMEIISNEEIQDCDIYLNGEEVNYNIDANRVTFVKDKDVSTIFSRTLGLVQFSLYIKDGSGNESRYYSEYASVLVRDTFKQKTIRDMLDYIYQNQADLLISKTDATACMDDSLEPYEDFGAQLELLHNIMDVYASLFGYFKMSSRSKLKQIETIDTAEKAQNINSRTIQHITSHPEYLKRSIFGIRIGKLNYVPAKLLMVQNRISNDIYENRIIVAFIRKLLTDIQPLKNEINSLLTKFKHLDLDKPGYVLSLRVLYLDAEEKLSGYYQELEQIELQFSRIYYQYKEILKVTEVECPIRPKPTAIFMSVPQYKEIFTYIIKWHSKAAYDFIKERQMITFTDIPSIYESYVLTRIVATLKKLGFKLISCSNYNFIRNSSYSCKRNEYNNTFDFQRNKQLITLYYEPVIYDDPYQPTNDILLYRNNNISYRSTSEEESRGRYYLPDYVIKAQTPAGDRYAICDAKYSRISKIRGNLVPELQYKYLFSISPTDASAKVKSMSLLYGITDENSSMESFYNAQGPITIYPRTEMIPFSVTMPDEIIESSIGNIIDDLF